MGRVLPCPGTHCGELLGCGATAPLAKGAVRAPHLGGSSYRPVGLWERHPQFARHKVAEQQKSEHKARQCQCHAPPPSAPLPLGSNMQKKGLQQAHIVVTLPYR